MSVLHLRRDMVVGDETETIDHDDASDGRRNEGARSSRSRPQKGRRTIDISRDPADPDLAGEDLGEEPVVEIEAALPIPLRRYEQPVEVEARIIVQPEADIDEDEDDRPTFFDIVSGWTKLALVIAALGAYPALAMRASNVGDAHVAGLVDHTQWSAPWAGAAATAMERQFTEIGWASDAPGWAPEARLTAKPAYQSALAAAIGEFTTLRADQEAAAGREDADLRAAARLATASSTGIQLRAARDALVSHDRRVRRRIGDDAPPVATPAETAAQLSLIASWAATSQDDIASSSSVLGGSPLDEVATQAVYRTKARALAAYLFIDATAWPQDATTAQARSAALEAWRAAAQFHPLIVLNGSPDGSLFGNHAVSMGYLVTQAQTATAAYLARVEAAIPPVAAVEPASEAVPG